MTTTQQAYEIIARADRNRTTACAETERFERMREAHREMYDLLQRMVIVSEGGHCWGQIQTLDDIKVCLARIDGATK